MKADCFASVGNGAFQLISLIHIVLASKTKFYMVVEYVTGGALIDKIATKGRLSDRNGRKLFQQLIDTVSHCHDKGVFHRDLKGTSALKIFNLIEGNKGKPSSSLSWLAIRKGTTQLANIISKRENVLIDSKENLKISDFGLSALPQHFKDEGLLHTTFRSPNYVAPEIFKGDTTIPKWISPGARNMISRILDPNPKTWIDMAGIKANEWFRKDYTPDNEEDIYIDNEAFSIKEPTEAENQGNLPNLINAFQLIGMSSCLDLSGFLEKEVVWDESTTSERQPRVSLWEIESLTTFPMQVGWDESTICWCIAAKIFYFKLTSKRSLGDEDTW